MASPAGPFTALFEPGRIGRLEVKNRVLMAPMEKNLCTSSGLITERYVDYLVARARGDVALLRVEATYVDPAGKGRPYQLGAHSDVVIPGLARMASAVHEAGGRVSLELAHCGRQTNSRVTGLQPVAPSPVPCERSGGYMPRELTIGEIETIVDRFARAARRAQEAGVDAIEIHGASGYLLNAFLSPFSNLREDAYGGSPAARMRFPLQVVAAVRDTVGADFPLIYRLCADEFVTGGLTPNDTAPFAAELERAGIDLIDVSAGIYESVLATQPPMEVAPGSLLDTASVIKAAVAIPVSTAGKLGNLDVAERALGAGMVDFVTIARGLHADPELLLKARAGRLTEARRCIACAECVAGLAAEGPAYCAINPATARESELSRSQTARSRSVLVVGAGPAGLEAARAARLRGHRVEVYERSSAVGGRARLGRLVHGRADFGEPVEFLARELARLEVPVNLDTELRADLIDRARPEVVIVATGARSSMRPIPGVDRPNVVAAAEFLAAREAGPRAARWREYPRAGASVAVVGGNWVGCNVAALLLEDGYLVTIVETREALAHDFGKQPGMVLVDRIAKDPNSTVHLAATVEHIQDESITVWHSVTCERTELPVDVVVIVESLEANLDLAHELRSRYKDQIEVHTIGDCVWPRKLQDAMLEGAMVAAQL